MDPSFAAGTVRATLRPCGQPEGGPGWSDPKQEAGVGPRGGWPRPTRIVSPAPASSRTRPKMPRKALNQVSPGKTHLAFQTKPQASHLTAAACFTDTVTGIGSRLHPRLHVPHGDLEAGSQLPPPPQTQGFLPDKPWASEPSCSTFLEKAR